MGLISDRMNPQDPAQQGRPVIAGQDPAQAGAANDQQEAMAPEDQGMEGQVTPEEQAVYTSVVSNAMNIIYGEESSQSVVEMIKSAPEPGEGVAQAAVAILDQMYMSGKKQGKTIGPDVLTAAGDEIIAMLFELAEKAGVVEAATDDDVFTAITRALQLWSESHPDMMDQKGMKQSMSEMDSGQLREILSQVGGQPGDQAPNPQGDM